MGNLKRGKSTDQTFSLYITLQRDFGNKLYVLLITQHQVASKLYRQFKMSYNDSYDRRGDERRYDDDRRGNEGGYGGDRRDDYGADSRDNYGRSEGGYGRDNDERGSYGRDEGRSHGRDERESYGRDDRDRRGDDYGGRQGGREDNRRGEGADYYDSSNRYDDSEQSGGRRHQGGGGGGYGQQSSGTGYGSVLSGDLDSAAALGAAKEHSAQARDDNIFASVFDNLMGRAQQIQSNSGDVDEGSAVEAHKQFYGNGNGQEAHNQNMGAAAAMQALKMFTGSSGGGGGSSVGQGGQSQFVGLAMAQAAKLFDQQAANGNTSSGASKEGAIQSAAEMALKFYLKSQMGGGGGGAASGSGGGLGGLMNIASKFLK